LETARRNSSLNGLEVHFLRADILTWETVLWKTYDIIVSNPPYVREMEKAKMQPNVLGYEPGIALFVPDTDPLVFYRRIAEFATKKLKNNGLLFFEINEELGSETVQLLNTLRFSNIQIKNDLRGKNRMLRCNT
jgi:release factor glutamine methyltransferase